MDLQRTRRSPTSQVSQQPIEKSSERSSGHRHPSLVWSHSLWCNTLLLAPEPAAPLPSLGKGSHGHKPMTLPSPDQCTSSSRPSREGFALSDAHTHLPTTSTRPAGEPCFPQIRANPGSSCSATAHWHRRIPGCWTPSAPSKGRSLRAGLILAELKFPR